jgi:type IX secretion system PorP/SprF family membrane protein
MIRLRNTLTLLCLFTYAFMRGQDIHFSQYLSSPLLINPGACGSFTGDYRISANYKSQWKSISNSYKTIAVCVDGKILKTGRDKGNYLGIGLSVFSDKAGKSNLSTNQANLNLAYNLKTSRKSSFSAGIQVGFFQRSIQIADLKWDNQFDGNNYDASLPSGESQTYQKIFRLDIGAGLLWRYYDKISQFKLELGGSVSHINKPQTSFYTNKQIVAGMKYIGHVNAQIKLGDMPVFIVPQIIYVNQSPYSELLAGGAIRYRLGEDTRSDASLNTFSLISSAVSLGVYYRAKDAVVIVASLEYRKSIAFGISYDLNTSKLNVASKYRGGMELSFSYKGLSKRTNMRHVALD